MWDWSTNVERPWRLNLQEVAAANAAAVGPEPYLVARVFDHPHFYARVVAVQPLAVTNDERGRRNANSRNIILDFGPHFAAFHGTSQRTYDFRTIAHSNANTQKVIILSPEESAAWGGATGEQKRTLHNAALAWKYSGRKKMMYETRRWLMRAGQSEIQDNYDSPWRPPTRRGTRTFPQGGLGRARGLLWLHLPLLQSAEQEMPSFPPVADLSERILVARARYALKCTRKIIPNSVLDEIENTKDAARPTQEDEEVADAVRSGSAAFPHDCFFGWSAMKLPLHKDLLLAAAPAPPAAVDANAADDATQPTDANAADDAPAEVHRPARAAQQPQIMARAAAAAALRARPGRRPSANLFEDWEERVKEWVRLVINDIQKHRDNSVFLCVNSCDIWDEDDKVRCSIFSSYAVAQTTPKTPPRGCFKLRTR